MDNKLLLIIPENKPKTAPPENEPALNAMFRVAKNVVWEASKIPSYYRGVSAIYERYQEWKRSDYRLETTVDARRKGLCFPPGHPIEGTLYAPHPVKENYYFSFANFHSSVRQHKFSEAVRLLMALGATHIKAEHVSGQRLGIGQTLDATTPSGSASVKSSFNQNKHEAMMWEAKCEGHTSPNLPWDLVWYPHEPTWEIIAQGRMQYGLKSFDLELNYTEDYGVNAEVAAKAEGCGTSIGGKFEEHVSTVWRIHGEFA